ncbi:MAG TPA: hypothetical protein VHX88_12555, partial [Solirubrobacteraceae bacterium]|nr:hypothetical protein [Solirubrobacteraceae bacterium]
MRPSHRPLRRMLSVLVHVSPLMVRVPVRGCRLALAGLRTMLEATARGLRGAGRGLARLRVAWAWQRGVRRARRQEAGRFARDLRHASAWALGAARPRRVLRGTLAVVLVAAATGAALGVAGHSSGHLHLRNSAVSLPTPPAPTAQTALALAQAAAAPPGSATAVAVDYFLRMSNAHVPAEWEDGFLPLYHEAAHTFGVNWLLIASIHRQETAFSTAPSTYHGLNYVHCCGGPMQFNVTNGPVTTWDLVRESYRMAPRPARYPHPTRDHPSIYDDFDAIMAAAALLSQDGATGALDGSAWNAAYEYYGPSFAGVTYADEVLARAIDWSQSGFCINCSTDPGLISEMDELYGAPVRQQLIEQARRHHHHRHKAKHKHASSHRSAGPSPPSSGASPPRRAPAHAPRPAPSTTATGTGTTAPSTVSAPTTTTGTTTTATTG